MSSEEHREQRVRPRSTWWLLVAVSIAIFVYVMMFGTLALRYVVDGDSVLALAVEPQC